MRFSRLMVENILTKFGNRLRQLRKERGLTQEKLAAKAGLHYTYIGSVERGEKNISLVNIERLAAMLDVEIIEFFPAEGKFKGYLLAERVADYLKTREPKEIEKVDRLVRLVFEERN